MPRSWQAGCNLSSDSAYLTVTCLPKHGVPITRCGADRDAVLMLGVSLGEVLWDWCRRNTQLNPRRTHGKRIPTNGATSTLDAFPVFCRRIADRSKRDYSAACS